MSGPPHPSYVISGPPMSNVEASAPEPLVHKYYADFLWYMQAYWPQGNVATNTKLPTDPALLYRWYCNRFESVFLGVLPPDHPVRVAIEFHVPGSSAYYHRGSFTILTLRGRIQKLREHRASMMASAPQAGSASAQQTSSSSSAPAPKPSSSSASQQSGSRPSSGSFQLPQPSSSRPASGSFSTAMHPKKQG